MDIWSVRICFLVPTLKIREQKREASSPYFSWAKYIILVIYKLFLKIRIAINASEVKELLIYTFLNQIFMIIIFLSNLYKGLLFSQFSLKQMLVKIINKWQYGIIKIYLITILIFDHNSDYEISQVILNETYCLFHPCMYTISPLYWLKNLA